jgi:hypothetical protein
MKNSGLSPINVLGQVVRIFGAGTKTAVGLVPAGNTGGATLLVAACLER